MRNGGRYRQPGRLVVTSLVVLLVGCSPGPQPQPSTPIVALPSSSPAQPPPSGPPEIHIAPALWTDCGRGFQCSTITVPLDYATGSGAMELSLVRLPARDASARIGPLLVNPGGPGASGVEFVRDNLDAFPSNIRRRFDLIGFDPRGVNQSSGIRCIDNLDPRADLDPSPDTSPELRALINDARSYAKACERRNGDVLPHLSTDDVVRDLDSIRISLREEKISYLGFSYGTLIGALYADRYPDRVRAMALDGALDPRLTLTQLRTGQARGFEGELNRFLANCARRSNCPLGRGSQVRRNFEAIMRRIERTPLRSLRTSDKRRVGPGIAWSAILGSMYSREAWPVLELALAYAAQGDGSVFLAVSDPYRGRKRNGTYSNMQDAYLANTCLDFKAPTQTGAYATLAKRLARISPHFGAFAVYTDLPCAFWPETGVRTPGRVSAKGAPPIVVVGTTGDPATPLAWARALANELDSGVLVTHQGDGHTAYAASGCVRDLLVRYLVTVKAPKEGTVCS
jgi:pimeloyl-ACP methyl ester carboxylesterase